MGRFVCESELVAKFRENFPLEENEQLLTFLVLLVTWYRYLVVSLEHAEPRIVELCFFTISRTVPKIPIKL